MRSGGTCLRAGVSLGLELIITEWASVLLVEMLFLGSMLMTVIVTNLAWGPVSQDLSPWWHSNSLPCPQTLPRALSPWLVWGQLSQDVCLGGGSGGALTTSRYSFSLFLAASWEVSNALLKIVGAGTLSTTFWCLCQKLFLFHFFLFFFFFSTKSQTWLFTLSFSLSL